MPLDDVNGRRAVKQLADSISFGVRVRSGVVADEEILRRYACEACGKPVAGHGSGEELLHSCVQEATEHLGQSRHCANILGQRMFGLAWIPYEVNDDGQ